MSEERIAGKIPVYRKNTITGESQMFCPECGEEIYPMDVESFLHCPYCNCVLKQDDEFDDFLLENVVKAWIAKTNHTIKG